jgi:hypothetical protein
MIDSKTFPAAYAAMDEAAKAFWAYPDENWQENFLAQWGRDNNVAALAALDAHTVESSKD